MPEYVKRGNDSTSRPSQSSYALLSSDGDGTNTRKKKVQNKATDEMRILLCDHRNGMMNKGLSAILSSRGVKRKGIVPSSGVRLAAGWVSEAQPTKWQSLGIGGLHPPYEGRDDPNGSQFRGGLTSDPARPASSRDEWSLADRRTARRAAVLDNCAPACDVEIVLEKC